MLFLDVTICFYSNKKRWTTKKAANRMLRNCQEDIRFCYVENRTINMTLVMLFLVGNKKRYLLGQIIVPATSHTKASFLYFYYVS